VRRLAWPASRRRHAPRPSLSIDVAVTIRYAFPDDESPLRRLAVLDSAVTPPAPLLVAEVEGQLRAALSLATGETIADPFHPSTALTELLRARAQQLTRERPRSRRQAADERAQARPARAG
jgi:hypothetical protein